MIFTIGENECIAPGVYKMTLEGDARGIYAPGQFVNIEIEGLFLRRPISVCDWGDGWLTLIYKVVGKGTSAMARREKGAELDMLVGRGNGFDADVDAQSPLVIGGGVGVPPMYGLAKRLIERGHSVTAILGFNTKEEIFFEREFEALGAKVIVCTVDGSYGEAGFVTGPMGRLAYDHVFACGPEMMLRAIYRASGDIPAQLSFEARMGCGFGACMGCSCRTLTGNKRICVEGPVMRKEEILWRM